MLKPAPTLFTAVLLSAVALICQHIVRSQQVVMQPVLVASNTTKPDEVLAWELLAEFAATTNSDPQSNWTSSCQLQLSDCKVNLSGPSLPQPPATKPASMADNVRSPYHAIWYGKDKNTVQTFNADLDKAAHLPSNSSGSPSSLPTFQNGAMIAVPAWITLDKNSASSVSVNLVDHVIPANAILPTQQIDISNPSCKEVPSSSPIPIGCFYSVKLTPGNLSFYQVNFPRLAAGQTLILVAFHVIKMQRGHWRWSTFWWQRQPNQITRGHYPCISADGSVCLNLPSPWNNYVMDTAASPSPSNTVIEPIFNPYLEGIFPNGNHTNCIVCHSFAAFPNPSGASTNLSFGGQHGITSAALQTSLNTYLTGKTSTNMLWSLEGEIDKPQFSENLARPVASPSKK